MRDRGWSHRLFAVAGLAAAAACLPTGDPPSGRQAIARRTDALVGALAVTSPDDCKLRFLVSRVRDDQTGTDLVLVTDGGAGAEPGVTTLIEHWTNPCATVRCAFPTDSRGRVLVSYSDPSGMYGSGVIRVDPVTGERTDLGKRTYFVLSPSRDRLAVFRSEPVIDLYEIDDRTTALSTNNGLFVGEDFYFVDDLQRLHRVTPHGTPEVLRQGVYSIWRPAGAIDRPILVLDLVGAALTGVTPQSLFDAITLQERMLPFDPNLRWTDVSPDGRWVFGKRSTSPAFRLLDLSDDGEESFDTPVYSSEAHWRPGGSELWLVSADESEAGWIKRPGMPLVDLPARPSVFVDGNGLLPSWFTRDGEYWFSEGALEGGVVWPVFVGPADDPAAVRLRLNPDGTKVFGYRGRADGTLLLEAMYSDDRSDVIVFDPATGQARTVGRRGSVWAVGDQRALALLGTVDRAGDLAALDLDGGGATTFASDYVVGAYAERRQPDLLAPGTRVVFQFHNRFASPYDGIWVTTLP